MAADERRNILVELLILEHSLPHDFALVVPDCVKTHICVHSDEVNRAQVIFLLL